MSHDRDHDHRKPEPQPREPALESTDCPDVKRPEHPTPRSPVDPRVHPSRRLYARASARPC